MITLFVLWQNNIVYFLVLVKFHPKNHLILFIVTFGVSSLSGAHYFLTIVDDYTRFTCIFLMKHKDEAQPLIKNFFSYVSTQFASHIKIFRSDNGGEFLSLQSFFKDNDVLFQHSCVYTPQQNGVVERKHRHILQVARALKFQA